MRVIPLVLLTGAAFPVDQASAADALKFGPPPPWVVQQPIPAASTSAADGPIAILLHDQQIALKTGTISTFSELAYKIQKPEGLAAGNVGLSWDPATDTVVVNKLEIHRGTQVIDILASGQKFTIVRREPNLEAATLDGVLTASMQPEGLQEGDVVVLATTTEHSDPVLKGHVEAIFAPWSSARIGLAHARLQWPTPLDLKIQATGNLPASRRGVRDGLTTYELTQAGVEPVIAPKDAPIRFAIGRMGEATDFRSWADAARLMMPLYNSAAVIPAAGPLHDELEKIRKASPDPKIRAGLALNLVQDRVRYVALLMGQGGFVPATADATWERRFGDCKAKTALLLGLLHELGIPADPVLANLAIGDAIGDRLPMIGVFNHVFVRAHIGDKDYWLDGTRSGDTALDSIEVPDYGWVLPLTDGAQLVHLTPAPLKTPSMERRVDVDATTGVYAPAAITLTEIYRGDGAVDMNNSYSALTGAQKDEVLRREANSFFDGFTLASSSLGFDKAKREFTISIKGAAKLSWNDGWLYVPASSIAFTPDFTRPTGPQQDAPIALNHPRFALDVAKFKFPAGFAGRQKLDAPVHETLAGVEYERSETVSGDTLTVTSSERSLVPEVPYKESLAAAARLKALDKDDVYLSMPGKYDFTDKDVAELKSRQPVAALDYFVRAEAYLSQRNLDDALTDLNAGLALDPKNVWALRNRAGIFLMKQRPEDAKKDVAAALAIRPNDNELLIMQASMAAASGSMDTGIEGISKLLQNNPKNVDALVQRAWLLNGKADSAGALRDFSAALDVDPKSITALIGRAEVYASKHDLASANRDLAAAEAIDPTNSMLATVKAQIGRQLNDLTAAVGPLTNRISANPKDGVAYASRAQAYLSFGKFDLALKDTDEALALGFNSPAMRLLRANIYMKQGNRTAVAREADLLVQENPSSTFAFTAAAKSYAAIGQNEKAMQVLERALAIRPDAYVYINRSQVRPKTDITGRLGDLEAALKIDPRSSDALLEKSRVLTETGDYARALAAMEQTNAADDLLIRTQRAILLSKLGRTTEAQDLAEAARASANSPEELNSICYTKATAGTMLESALQDCMAALKLTPGEASYEDSLGMVLLRLGRLDDAIAAYSSALAKRPIPESYMGRALAYARKGNRAAAQKDKAEAIKLNAGIETLFAGYGLKLDETAAAQATPAKVQPATKH